MSKKFLLLVCAIMFIGLAATPLHAQKSKGKRSSGVSEYLEDKGNFASKLWYGGGFNLGFSGNSFYNLFNLGVSPMVGYKVFPSFSVGPRFSLQYTYIRGIGTDGNVHKVQPISFSYGVFARYKFLRSLFAHLEYEHENAEFPYFNGPYLYYDATQAKIATERVSWDNVYVGAGYNSSGGNGFGYEIMLLYNITQPANSFDLPFDIRFGFTYNF